MTELLQQIVTSATDVCNKLNELKEAISDRDYFGVFAPWVLSIISAFFGYYISSGNERRAFKRNCHIEYLSFTNDFLTEINSVITELVNLQKIGFIIMNFINNPEFSESYFYGNLKDYNFVITKIRDLRKEIDNLKIDNSVYSTQQEYIKQYTLQSDDVLKFDKFISICTKYQQKSAKYYYLIARALRKEHAELINTIAKATKNNMIGFNIEDYKNLLVEHILHINKQIIGHKIREPNWFNQNDSVENV